MFIRVKDPATGHEFDLPEGHRLIERELVKPVKSNRYPPSPIARPAKFAVAKLRQAPIPTPEAPATDEPVQSASSSEAPQDATEKEN